MPTGIYIRTKPVWNKGLKGQIPWNKGKKTGQIVWNKDKKCPEISVRQIGEKNHMFGVIGEKSVRWKGDRAKYRAIHSWIERTIGKLNKCSDCGKIGYKKHIHWANIDHKYNRKLSDWIRLCASCHKKHDINSFQMATTPTLTSNNQ